MINACLNAVPDAAEQSYDSLRLFFHGGAAIDERTLRRAMEVFQCDFVQTLGIIEAGCATFLRPEDHRRGLTEKPELLTSAGRPTVGTELRVVNDGGQLVPNGAVGELIIRTPQIMTGYWNRAQETEKARSMPDLTFSGLFSSRSEPMGQTAYQ